MRTALIGIFLATALAAPLAAQTVEDAPAVDERDMTRPGTDEGRLERASRQERRVEDGQPSRPERTEQRRERRERQAQRSESRAENHDSGSARRARERPARHDRLHRDYRREHQDLHRSNPTRREHRQFHSEVNRDHNRYHGQWDHNWRSDRRFDWQAYRFYNRGLFDLAPYYSPSRGQGYRRFSIGFRLGSSFYSHPYWISDPWRYRLPPAYAGTRWVRYHDDVLLVDLFTGEVVDAIYNFFW